MAMDKKIFGLFLVVSLLLAFHGSMVEVEAACRRKPSMYFKGGCFSLISDGACKSACNREGMPVGVCVPVYRCECRAC